MVPGGTSIEGGAVETPVCECHGEPMWFQPDRRRKPGGYWRCRVRANETAAAYGRRRYERDPVYRISKNLHDHARRRAATLLKQEARLGSLPREGRDRPPVERDTEGSNSQD